MEHKSGNPVPPKKVQKKILSAPLALILLVFFSVLIFLQRTYYSSDTSNSRSSAFIGIKPASAVIKGTGRFLAGECYKLTVALKNSQGAESAGEEVFVQAFDSAGLPITTFNGPQCKVDDLPNLDFQVTAGKSSSDFFLATATLGKVSFKVFTNDKSSVDIDDVNVPVVESNYRKARIEYSNIPEEITVGDPFTLEVSIHDPFGHPIEKSEQKAILSIAQGESLAEGTIVGGLAEFKNIILTKYDGKSLNFKIKFGDSDLQSTSIKVNPFLIRPIVIDIEGGGRYYVREIAPLTYDFKGVILKAERNGVEYTVEVNGHSYVGQFLKKEYIRMKKKSK